MFEAMYPVIFIHLLLVSLFTISLSLEAESETPNPQITVLGVVYCDVCSNNTFSRHSYFIPGAEVHIDCKFKASSPRTTEQISFSVNRTTNKFGVYKLEIPSVDGIQCADSPEIVSSCQASLIGGSSSSCNVPGLKTTSDEISIKSRQANICIYSLGALNYRPRKRNIALCGKYKEDQSGSLNSSKFFLPFFPPYSFPLPPLPHLPPFPSFPFPPLPPFPYYPLPPMPFPNPPSLPFPFPPLPPTPSEFPCPPPPPSFDLRDPRTWIPLVPPFPPHHPKNQNP